MFKKKVADLDEQIQEQTLKMQRDYLEAEELHESLYIARENAIRLSDLLKKAS